MVLLHTEGDGTLGEGEGREAIIYGSGICISDLLAGHDEKGEGTERM